MSLFDLILLAVLGAFVLYGLWSGLIRALGALVGIVAGVFIAGRLFGPLSVTFAWLFAGNENIAKVVIFFVLFVLTNRLVGFGFHLLDRTFRIIAIIPFLKTINRLAGAIFGFLEGAIVLGAALWLATRFPLGGAFDAALLTSTVVPWLLGIANIIVPLLPELVRHAEALIHPTPR